MNNESQSQNSKSQSNPKLVQLALSAHSANKSTNMNKNKTIVRMLENVVVSLSLLLPSVITAFQAAAAETPEVYLLVTV